MTAPRAVWWHSLCFWLCIWGSLGFWAASSWLPRWITLQELRYAYIERDRVIRKWEELVTLRVQQFRLDSDYVETQARRRARAIEGMSGDLSTRMERRTTADTNDDSDKISPPAIVPLWLRNLVHERWFCTGCWLFSCVLLALGFTLFPLPGDWRSSLRSSCSNHELTTYQE